jgi:dienelactone hydrolase
MSHRIHLALQLLVLVLSIGIISSAALAEDKSSAQTVEQAIERARIAALAEGKSQAVQFPSVKGEKIELVGYLRRPDGAGPFPAVILLHGCAGDWPGMDTRWGARLVKWGYVALSVDSFGPRGIKSVCGGGESFDRVFDAYAALSFLAAQPSVAPDRIAVMGVSGGATVALWDVERDFIENSFKHKFRGAIALYPSCAATTWAMTVPTLILIGELDDLTPAAACREMVKRVSNSPNGREGAPVRLRVYPGAYHAFDNTRFRTGQRFLGQHWLEYNAGATMESVKEIRNFLRNNLGD